MKLLIRLLALISLLMAIIAIYAYINKYGEVNAHLAWEPPEVRPSIMSVGYKIYGNPKIDNGHFYLSKIQFKNTGDHPVTDFQISYKVDDYTTDWSEPEIHKEVPPGLSFNELYYPRFQDKIAKLRNNVTSTFRARVRWKEEGKDHEEIFTRDLLIHSINTLVYTDIPQKERVIFQDYFNSAAFAMTMVTPNDPVVTAYASEITKLAGGTTAGINGGREEIVRICRYIYNYMILTKLRYVGDAGTSNTFGDVQTLTQSVRLPREVIIDNQGLCIELSLLWASILEHIGVRCTVLFVPGHAFILAYAPNDGVPYDRGITIETTAITPMAVGEKELVPFEKATVFAAKAYDKYSASGDMIKLDVQTYQNYGFTPPELPDYDVSKLVPILASRFPHEEQTVVNNTPLKSQANDNSGSQQTQQDQPPFNPNIQTPVSTNEQQPVAPINPDPKNNTDDELVVFTSQDNQISIAHYKEWEAQPLGSDGVKLYHDQAFILISKMSGATSGSQILQILSKQFYQNYQNLKLIDQGRLNFPTNRIGYNSRFTGNNKLGQLVHLSLAGVDGINSDGYGIIISAPDNDYINIRDDMNEMLRTLIFK